MQLLRSVWSYRGFILGSVKREFQSRYRNSMLGAAWMIINPLAMITVYTVIFSQMMRTRLPGVESHLGYSIYLCAGTLTWGLFSEILSRAQNVFIDQANLIKKLSFPRICLPAIVVLGSGLNLAIIFSIFIAVLIATGNFPGWVFVTIFPLLLLHIAFAIGLGITLGVLNVFFRDVGQFMGVVLQFWFWLTPIVYPISALPEMARSLIKLNPMVPLIAAYQSILVNKLPPDWMALLPTAVLAIVFCLMGMKLFRAHSGEMVDEL